MTDGCGWNTDGKQPGGSENLVYLGAYLKANGCDSVLHTDIHFVIVLFFSLLLDVDCKNTRQLQSWLDCRDINRYILRDLDYLFSSVPSLVFDVDCAKVCLIFNFF